MIAQQECVSVKKVRSAMDLLVSEEIVTPSEGVGLSSGSALVGWR